MTDIFVSGAPEGEEIVTLKGARAAAFMDGVIQPDEPDLIILPAVTLWERLTEDEADQVNEVMATQPVRTQRIFTTANTFRSDHELWPLLMQMANDLFGEARAAELLAAT